MKFGKVFSIGGINYYRMYYTSYWVETRKRRDGSAGRRKPGELFERAATENQFGGNSGVRVRTPTLRGPGDASQSRGIGGEGVKRMGEGDTVHEGSIPGCTISKSSPVATGIDEGDIDGHGECGGAGHALR